VISQQRTGRWAAVLAALVALVQASCGGSGDPSAADAQDCWGTGADGADCAEAIGRAAQNLGVTPPADDSWLTTDDCGDAVDCDAVADTTTDQRTEGTHTHVVEPITEQGGVEPPTHGYVAPDPGDDDAAEAVTPPPPPDPVATSWPTSCLGHDVRRVAQRGQPFTDGEIGCMRDVALDHEPLEIDDFTAIQEATIGLVNARDGNWQQAVERSLSYSELRNSPNLNFAGITPAYNQGRYSTVISRANCVWSNLDKGYAVSASDRTFVAEFACRSGVQLHMQGQISPDHERWCRIWTDRLEHEGGDATEARGLLEQVE
jgi:hypothetical protein